jgi:hypothetical protein
VTAEDFVTVPRQLLSDLQGEIAKVRKLAQETADRVAKLVEEDDDTDEPIDPVAEQSARYMTALRERQLRPRKNPTEAIR